MRIDRRLLFACAVLAAFALAAAWQANVASWDLRNYHVYVPWAWLNGRLDFDVGAAQVQTFNNPTLLLWLPWSATHLPAGALNAALGAVQGLNALLLLALARNVFARDPSLPRWLPLVIALVGATAATQVAELGTSNGDNLVTIPWLAALVLLTRRTVPTLPSWHVVAAGALLGAAAALKLTNAPAALGALVAACLLPTDRRSEHIARLVAGAWLGFALCAGPWMLSQYLRYGDPLYPYLPWLFPNPQVLDPVPHELRYLERHWFARFTHPIAWAFDWRRISDLKFRDLRLPLLYVGVLALAWRARRRNAAGDWQLLRALLTGVVVAYGAWLALFGYHRYLLPLELVACLLLAMLLRAAAIPHATRWIVGIAVIAIATTNPANLGVLVSRTEPVWSVQLPQGIDLEDTTVVVAGGDPLAYIALALPDSAAMVRIESNFDGVGDRATPFGKLVAARLASATRVAALFQADLPRAAPSAYASLGIVVDDAHCGRVASPLMPLHELPTWLCPAQSKASR